MAAKSSWFHFGNQIHTTLGFQQYSQWNKVLYTFSLIIRFYTSVVSLLTKKSSIFEKSFKSQSGAVLKNDHQSEAKQIQDWCSKGRQKQKWAALGGKCALWMLIGHASTVQRHSPVRASKNSTSRCNENYTFYGVCIWLYSLGTTHLVCTQFPPDCGWLQGGSFTKKKGKMPDCYFSGEGKNWKRLNFWSILLIVMIASTHN